MAPQSARGPASAAAGAPGAPGPGGGGQGPPSGVQKGRHSRVSVGDASQLQSEVIVTPAVDAGACGGGAEP